MSLAKLLAGRRRESSVWDYFKFSDDTQKSMCMVFDDKLGRNCGVVLAGKNSSNLVNHLARLHKEAHTEYEQKEKARAEGKVDSKRMRLVTQPTVTVKSQSLQDCLKRRIVKWSNDSVEHKQRMTAVLDMLISTGYPVTLVDQPSFRTLMKTMDPKFAVPGNI